VAAQGSGEPQAEFKPLRPATPRGMALLLLLAPVIWVVALAVTALVLHRRDAVEYALVVLTISFLIALILAGWSRAHRVREERDP
jgi:hypothetical protein